MTHDGRAVCPSCGRLASRLAAMDEVEPTPPQPPAEPIAPPPARPAPLAPPAPPVASTPPPVAPVTAPRPPAPPTGLHTPTNEEPAGSADGPVAPGGRWPTPAPLPPDEDGGRPWWKLAVPAAAVVLLLGIVAAMTLGGGGGSSDTSAAPAPSKGVEKVDLSDIEDPTVTTTRPATTTTEATATTVVTADGRYVGESESGIAWSMTSAPEVADAETGSGTTWTATAGDTTEQVEISGLDGGAFVPDEALAAVATRFGGELGDIEASHIEDAPGRTAPFTGTIDGQPVVGYAVAAQVGDESLVVTMWRETDDFTGLYVDWLTLPSSFELP